jgi:ribonucleoside-diphosphate reductase alpha chain
MEFKTEKIEKNMNGTNKVKKRSGKLEDFDVNKINTFVERACHGRDNVSASEIVLDMKMSFYNKIKTSDIDKSIELTARQKVYKEPNYSYVAAQVVLSSLYKEVLNESVDADTFEEDYRSAFVKNIKKGVKNGIYSENLLKYDLRELSRYLVPDRDNIFKYVGIRNICDRYLIKHNGSSIETPQAFYMRIAMGLCVDEPDMQQRVKELYDVYSTHSASASTPTLFNSGTIHNQLSSCYLSEIDDSIDGIFDGLWQEARKSKYAGGLGFHMSSIRASGSHIKGTNGTSSGLVPWLKVYNDTLIACDQAGKRQGSGCVYIEPWHYDIYEFIDLRKVGGEERRRCHDLNTALWSCDLFFDRIKNDGDWTLFCPSEVPELVNLYGVDFESKYVEYESKARDGDIKQYKIVSAKELWKKILRSLFETSHPWITYKDNANLRYSNIHEGVLHGSNLCTEIFLHTKHSDYKDGVKTKVGETAVCNLSSVNLSEHVVDGKIDYDKLKNTISIVIRALDNVIDINFYPTEEARNSNMRHRPIGMGTMGWSDLYAKLGIVHDSDEAVELADKLMEFISLHAIYNSSLLAKERGHYESYIGSKWSKNEFPIDTWNQLMEFKKTPELKSNETFKEWKDVREHVEKYGMRNSNVMAIAPNASIAYQVGCEQSIEPTYTNLFRYENKSGNYYIVNFNLVNDLKKMGLWNYEMAEMIKQNDGSLSDLKLPQNIKDIYKTAFERDMFKLIEANSRRQKWVDQGISFNLYNNHTSLKFLNDVYIECNYRGLKSTYYLRNKSASKMQSVTSETFEKNNGTDVVTDEKIQEFQLKLEAARNAAMTGGSCEMCEG